MRPVVVYIQPDIHIQVKPGKVCIGDVMPVYCPERALQTRVEALHLLTVAPGTAKKIVVCAMAVIALIHEQLSDGVIVENLGENEFIISLKEEKPKGLGTFAKVLFVTLVTFIGSIFAIMTYNEDVDVTGVFDRIYYVITGTARSAPGVLEAAYAIGVALGIVVFFNHFGRHKLTADPTPMEIEMEKYETDIGQTLIKAAGRLDRVVEQLPPEGEE